MNSVLLKTIASITLFLLVGTGACFSQVTLPADKLSPQAQKEFLAGNFSGAERDFREIAKRNPPNVYVYFFLGQSLFRQEKYSFAIAPFERARELEKSGQTFSSDLHRVLIDQLVMAFGISGDTKQARVLLDEAIRQDPDYPLNYYNLACLSAETGDKAQALSNIAIAFQHKDKVLHGEQIPDPRSDSSFQKYVKDPDFVKLMHDIGYK